MRLPSGRGMVASYQGIWLVNLYAPSGTANRQEREDFYNAELVYLLQTLPPHHDSRGRLQLRLVTGGLHRKYELQ